jgi:hypothetical protein
MKSDPLKCFLEQLHAFKNGIEDSRLKGVTFTLLYVCMYQYIHVYARF